MEGLIPFIYRLIIRFRSGEQQTTNGFWFDEPHLAAPYVRLADGSQVPSENISSTSSNLSASQVCPYELVQLVNEKHFV
ncbi:hypothetical protein GQ457_15G027980 [Hibiscus cannabinus]